MESILIADDDINLGKALAAELEEAGYEVTIVSDGLQVFEYLSANTIDLLLLDLKMPKMNGFEVLEELNRRKIKIHVIVLTSYSGVQQIVGTSVLGKRDFIHKPYDFQELLEKIEDVIQKVG